MSREGFSIQTRNWTARDTGRISLAGGQKGSRRKDLAGSYNRDPACRNESVQENGSGVANQLNRGIAGEKRPADEFEVVGGLHLNCSASCHAARPSGVTVILAGSRPIARDLTASEIVSDRSSPSDSGFSVPRIIATRSPSRVACTRVW